MSNYECHCSEFKLKVNDLFNLAKTVCAFANSVGGDISIGINDDGKVVGIDGADLDRQQLELTNAIRLVQPIPYHQMVVDEVDARKIVRAHIFPLSEGTFCSVRGIIYQRSGSSNLKLEGASLHDFLVRRRVREFDRHPSQAGKDDVSLAKVRDFLAIRSPGIVFDPAVLERYLVRLEAAYDETRFHLNNAGVLFFGLKPRDFLPQNEVRCVRFKGREPVDIIDRKVIYNTIPASIEECQEFISRNTAMGMALDGMRRKDVPEYPTTVVREATVNALAHRDYFSPAVTQINIYDDRIEWVNPLVLPEGFSIDNLGAISLPRNPLIYRFLRDLGYIEGLGTGIPRIKFTLAKEGHPNPVLEKLGPMFRITVYNKGGDRAPLEGLVQRQMKLIHGMNPGDEMTSQVYAARHKLSRPSAVKELNELCERGLMNRVGRGCSTRYVIVREEH